MKLKTIQQALQEISNETLVQINGELKFIYIMSKSPLRTIANDVFPEGDTYPSFVKMIEPVKAELLNRGL